MKSLLIATLLGAAVLALAACAGDGQAPPPGDGPDPTPTPTPTHTPTPTPTSTPTPPEPTPTVGLLDAGGRGPFEFSQTEFNFSVGETVTLVLKSESQFHTFTVDDLGIDVPVNGGETVNFSFTFDKPGTYQLICVPHEALGMVGTITVK